MAEGGRKTAATAEAAKAAERARDAEALVRMVAAYHDDMARVAFVVSGLPGLAQAAAAAAWASAWQARASLRNAEHVQPKLLGLAANEARTLTNDEAERSQGAAVASGAPTTEAAVEPDYRSDEVELANVLGELDEHDRMIIGLRYIGNVPPEQIGIELGMPGGAVLARVARILDHLLNDPRFAATPNETVEEYERELARSLRMLTDRALVPFDPDLVAQTAIDAEPEPTLAERLEARRQQLLERLNLVDRWVWMAVGGIVVAVAAFAFLGASGGAPVVTPVPTDATRLCMPTELAARITAWTAADAERVASVELRNTSAGACLIEALSEPWLTDETHVALITGQDQAAGLVRIGPGDTLRTRVHVSNYCGPAPQPPVTVAFRQRTDVMAADPLNNTDASGVPPCSNSAAGPGISMEPWTP